MLGEREHVVVEAAEQEAAVPREPRDLRHVVAAADVERVRVTRPVGILDLQQGPVVAERPAVERARQGHPVVGLAPADHGAAVCARIDQAVQVAVLVAGDDDGLAADVGGEVVARIRHLALVGEVDPVALEDVLHLEFEDVLVGEDAPVGPEHAGVRVVDDGVGQDVGDGVQGCGHRCLQRAFV